MSSIDGVGVAKRPPRTRGGRGRPRPTPQHPLRSSPHTRGSRWLRAGLLPGRKVLPAHAGVEALRRPRSQPRVRPPRTRGGRGVISALLGGFSAVLPAHAGVEGSGRRSSTPCAGPPRTRGGRGVSSVTLTGRLGSSPHTRGSRLSLDRLKDGCHVLPAHAGVEVSARSMVSIAESPPRTRGGRGHPDRRMSVPSESSPHTRGSRLPTEPDGLDLLRPPRTRGGRGNSCQFLKLNRASSPHTRGSRLNLV